MIIDYLSSTTVTAGTDVLAVFEPVNFKGPHLKVETLAMMSSAVSVTADVGIIRGDRFISRALFEVTAGFLTLPIRFYNFYLLPGERLFVRIRGALSQDTILTLQVHGIVSEKV